MPRRPPAICTHPGCKALTDGGNRCKNHPAKSGWAKTEERRGNRHERGYGARWVKQRELILKRDNFLCQPCLAQGRTTQARDVDHIVPKALGGTDDESNLQSICRACHKAKTQAEKRRGGGQK